MGLDTSRLGVRAHGERRVGHVGRDEISAVTEIKDD